MTWEEGPSTTHPQGCCFWWHCQGLPHEANWVRGHLRAGLQGPLLPVRCREEELSLMIP